MNITKRHQVHAEVMFAITIQTMVLILEGNSGIDAHVWSHLCYLICVTHLIRSTAVRNPIFPPKRNMKYHAQGYLPGKGICLDVCKESVSQLCYILVNLDWSKYRVRRANVTRIMAKTGILYTPLRLIYTPLVNWR